MATKRTTHRSKSGKKLYAVRGTTGQFRDIQSYKRAHAKTYDVGAKAERRSTNK